MFEIRLAAKGMRLMRSRGFLLIAILLYTGGLLYLSDIFYAPGLERFLTPRNIGAFLISLSVLFIIAQYLGVLSDRTEAPARPSAIPSEEMQNTLRELRNYIVHARPTSTPPTQINIDEDFKNQLLARLTTESQSALSSFVESEVFKRAAEKSFKEDKFKTLANDVETVIETYQIDMASWRRNANVNLMIGLVCAVAGIAVMWQTLVTLPFEIETSGAWRINDLYHFLSRLGLVVIIESVAFFFLKLYREDRSMIRYFRNEITNLESKAAALKTALVFGTPADLSKILQTLGGTERNFLVKKGERIMTDITYENSDILLEKLIERRPDLIDRITKLAVGKKNA